ncbi:MAG: hypothetical protein CTY18_01180 [Methylomonas sp.]|nr:MAG: hypothetical protein CTY18_01180 [Methylomonas sp.]
MSFSSLHFYRQSFKNDALAGIVVFLVALPLCLGVALASGAPLFSGLIAGMVGGLIVSWLSGSQLSVSGPAAGLTVIVFNAIDNLGDFKVFLLAVFLAGLIQLILGFFKAGIIGAFFPSAVIKGMLAAIGLILILKQIPHAIGYDSSFEGDESYMQETIGSTLHELIWSLEIISPGATIISVVSILILILWESDVLKKLSFLKTVPGALVVVIWGVAFNALALNFAPEWAVFPKHLVLLPIAKDPYAFIEFFSLPDFTQFANPKVYVIAGELAIVASLETLLSLEAVDKMDPHKRVAPTSQELKAQGVGNMISGLLGGLPITAVIVRSAANVNAGAQSRISSFIHGLLLSLSVLFFSRYINQIPLSCLAAILLQTGYKLAKPKLFMEYFHKGWNQFAPFVITVVAILLTDLLVGIAIGMLVGIFFVIKANYHAAISLTKPENNYLLRLNKDVSFLNRALLRRFLEQIEDGSSLIIDGSKTRFIDHDILETIQDYLIASKDKNIDVEVIDLHGKTHIIESPTGDHV